MSDKLRTEQGMLNETCPIGPKRYFYDDMEISEQRYNELAAQRAREIDAGQGGLVD